MANPTRTYSKKRYRKFRRYRKKNMYTIAKQVVYKAINRNMEKKYFDVNVNHTIPSAGTLYDLSAYIQRGTGNGQRVGDKLFITSIFMRLLFSVASGDDSLNYVRISLLQGKGVLALGDMPGVLDPLNTEKLSIKYDKVTGIVPYEPTSQLGGGVPAYKILEQEIFINKQINYKGNTGSVGDTTNGIYLYDVIANGVNAHVLTGFIRIKYRDG